jgi:hypothetical protein
MEIIMHSQRQSQTKKCLLNVIVVVGLDIGPKLAMTIWGGVQISCPTTKILSWRKKWPRDQGGQWLFWRHIITFHGCSGQLGYWWRNLSYRRHKR